MEQGICLHSVKILIKFRIFHYSIWSEGREILKKITMTNQLKVNDNLACLEPPPYKNPKPS